MKDIRAGRGRSSDRGVQLSPVQMYAASKRPYDATHLMLPREWGLSEKALKRIPGEGIRLGPLVFWSPDLQPYVSSAASKVRKGPAYVVKYDAAALSDGSLESIDIYRIEESKRRVFLLTCPARHIVRREMSEESMILWRKQYESQVLSRARDREQALRTMEASRSAQERLAAMQAERDRAHWAAIHGEDPVPVRPFAGQRTTPGRPKTPHDNVADLPTNAPEAADEEVVDLLGPGFDVVQPQNATDPMEADS